MTAAPNARPPLAALAWAGAATLYGVLFLGAESERALGTLLVIATAAVVLGARFGLVDRIRASIGGNERAFDIAAVAGVLVVGLWFHEEHFIILMTTTALLLMVAALGLTIQFGYAGVVNFAGAAFLGIGCYTAGVVTKYTALPSSPSPSSSCSRCFWRSTTRSADRKESRSSRSSCSAGTSTARSGSATSPPRSISPTCCWRSSCWY